MANRSPTPQEMAFYQRDEVRRLLNIFGKPKAPTTIDEEQFDGNSDLLEELASKRWHELDHTVFSPFLMDMVYVPLQGDLFMYLFPVILIRWSEYLESYDWHQDLKSEATLYRALLKGHIFEKVIPKQANDVLDWMADAFALSIDSLDGSKLGPSFSVFNALGQSCIITEQIWKRISVANSGGKCLWLLSFFSNLIMPNDLAALYPAESSNDVFEADILSTYSCIYDAGYLEKNRLFLETVLTIDAVQKSLESLPEQHISPGDRVWASYLLEHISDNADWVRSRITKYLSYLNEPTLGSFLADLDKP